MILIFLLVSKATQFTMSVQQPTCSCFDIPQQDICLGTYFCDWNITSSSCIDLTCDKVTNQTWCNNILPISYGCAWKNGACGKFTKCSDYLVTKPSDCYNIWFCADGGQTANGSFVCAESPFEVDENTSIECDKFDSDENCFGIQDDSLFCIWNTTNNNCTAQSIKDCSEASEMYCNTASCDWDETNQVCEDLSCDKFPTEELCKFYFSFDQSEVTPCLWNGTSCIDFSIVELKDYQCLNTTLNTYIWSSVQVRCIQCAYELIVAIINLFFFFI